MPFIWRPPGGGKGRMDEKSVAGIKKPRIAWIDIAKAIAILAMIEGHVVVYGGYARNLIYSFHMPLFFILTGYTVKQVTCLREFLTAVKKDFLKIMLPCIATQAVNGLLSYLIYDETAIDSLRLRIEQLFWGSAIDVYGHSCLGMIWFLVALFWTKVLYYIVCLTFRSKYNGAVFLALAVAGKMLSVYGKYLPQSLDIVCVAVLFVYIGHVFREIYPLFEKYQLSITAVSFVVWMVCWEKGIFLELGGHWYPDFGLGILETVCGCICVFTFSKALESCRPLSFILQKIGQHTLMILCLSHIDWLTISVWGYKPMWLTLLLRPGLALGGTLLLTEAVWLGKRIWETVSSKKVR